MACQGHVNIQHDCWSTTRQTILLHRRYNTYCIYFVLFCCLKKQKQLSNILTGDKAIKQAQQGFFFFWFLFIYSVSFGFYHRPTRTRATTKGQLIGGTATQALPLLLLVLFLFFG
jgi:hypothetical protein